jgi:molybdenum cofactor biosynthesis enzyme MoaA
MVSRRINISLDTLNADKFRAITRWGNLDNVMAGIDAAQAQGLAIKINAVALKGVNEDEIVNLLEWAHGRGMDLTVIEVMPLGDVDESRSRSVFCRYRSYGQNWRSGLRSETSTTVREGLPATYV